jgi:HSP20 family protein
MATGLTKRVSQALRPFFTRDPFVGFQQEFDDLLSRFKADYNGDGMFAVMSPSVDLSETDDALQIRMDVPGLKTDEINVEVSGNVVRISGEHKEEKEEKGKTFHRLERSSGSFARALTLPVPVKEDRVTAEAADGVLTITLPRGARANSPRRSTRRSPAISILAAQKFTGRHSWPEVWPDRSPRGGSFLNHGRLAPRVEVSCTIFKGS